MAPEGPEAVSVPPGDPFGLHFELRYQAEVAPCLALGMPCWDQQVAW